MPEASTSTAAKLRDQRRSRKREMFCPSHLEQLLAGGGRRYFLHLLSAEELSQRGMPAAKAKLLISDYAVYTLSNEWLEELFCHNCGMARWRYVVRHNRVEHTVGWALRELVAHVEPLRTSPSISDFSRREALRANRTGAVGSLRPPRHLLSASIQPAPANALQFQLTHPNNRWYW